MRAGGRAGVAWVIVLASLVMVARAPGGGAAATVALQVQPDGVAVQVDAGAGPVGMKAANPLAEAQSLHVNPPDPGVSVPGIALPIGSMGAGVVDGSASILFSAGDAAVATMPSCEQLDPSSDSICAPILGNIGFYHSNGDRNGGDPCRLLSCVCSAQSCWPDYPSTYDVGAGWARLVVATFDRAAENVGLTSAPQAIGAEVQPVTLTTPSVGLGEVRGLAVSTESLADAWAEETPSLSYEQSVDPPELPIPPLSMAAESQEPSGASILITPLLESTEGQAIGPETTSAPGSLAVPVVGPGLVAARSAPGNGEVSPVQVRAESAGLGIAPSWAFAEPIGSLLAGSGFALAWAL